MRDPKCDIAANSMDPGKRASISIVIKALNEAPGIGRCIASALRALEGLGGEVILADSGSTDGTLEIASAYPIEIVQIADPSERRCGIGPQLGFQFAEGDWIYILDADMELLPGFLEAALVALQADSQLAGVAGLVTETSTDSVQFRSRSSRNLEGTPGERLWLDMGGLYRRAALCSVGYASNRNLYAHEEQDLGLRLCAAGWTLRRLPVPAVVHHGHPDPTLALLRKRWRSGYLFGAGQMLRAAFGRSYFPSVLRVQRHLIVTLGLLALLIVGIATAAVSLVPLTVWLILLGLLIGQRTWRYRSIRDGLLSVLVWHVNAVALVRGLFLRQVDPRIQLEARVLASTRS